MQYPLESYLLLIPIGFAVGTVGTLIGAGGGFVLVPVLLLLYPQANPETITSISLAVVFFNALSGSWAYARLGRIDYKSGLLFAAATVPGAILGALTTDDIPRRLFDAVLGLLMIGAMAYLMVNRKAAARVLPAGGPHQTQRHLVERDGTAHTYAYNLKQGTGWSLLVGYVSSVLGIGGGIVHVPVLVRLLNFPVHLATATSHFILAIMALTGTAVHVAAGSFAQGGLYRTLFLSLGVLPGAQVGAFLSTRLHGRWVIRGLAVALGLVGIRILFLAVRP